MSVAPYTGNLAVFGPQSTRWPNEGGVRVVVTEADGISHAWQMPDASIKAQMLMTPSAAKLAEFAAIAAAQAAVNTKRQTAITAVRAEVTRIKAIAAGSRTTTERGFLGIAYLVFTEE
jgi:hypothetical protein